MTEDVRMKIAAVGDISIGDHPVCVGHGMRHTLAKNGADLFSEVKDILNAAEITVGNLETVASNKNLRSWYLPSYEMRGEPASLALLEDSGFNILSVANNHAMQHGKEAFQDTVENIGQYGMEAIGVDDPVNGATKPFVYRKGNKEHVLVAFSMRPEEWSPDDIPYSFRKSEEHIFEEVRALRSRHNGFLIVSIHWGLEYLPYPGPSQIRIGRRLIDEGVSVVIGHHPHVIQPIEYYNQGVILYSLGDFLFDLWHPETKVRMIATIDLKEDCVPEVNIETLEADQSFRPIRASEEKTKEIMEVLYGSKDEIADSINKSDSEYWEEYKKKLIYVRPRKYKYFKKNIRTYSLLFIIQSILRTFHRRLSGK
ncbi:MULTISPECIES: CapA family protein [Halomonadaceae]|uniref:Capsule synthesis protein CapA domain-containing protein n=1 Tax=Vreelandella halophila TaxID=86177 RepID=A0A9X5B4Q9_9GAMM|nr:MULTISPECIES: CapA family protein [Halomonas]MYL26831.1 hypothetical protein [Halomonas utahensis]MYL74092.1 hypothetical protein [Halomonas sp. 22501_18_FS]